MADTSDAAARALRIAARHGFGATGAIRLDGGTVNNTFQLTSSPPVLVRSPIDPTNTDLDKEIWCLPAAARAGIRTPQLLASDHDNHGPYLIELFITGAPIAGGAWRRLGEIARRIAEIPLAGAPQVLFTRFGANLPAAFGQHLDYNLAGLERAAELAGVPASLVPALRTRIAGLAGAEFSFGLAHSDLAPRNVLIAPDGVPVVLDWGAAVTGPHPWTDLERIHWCSLEGTVSEQALVDFAAGCGLPLPEHRATLEALSLLHHMDLVHWAAQRRPAELPRYVSAARRAVVTILDGAA